MSSSLVGTSLHTGIGSVLWSKFCGSLDILWIYPDIMIGIQQTCACAQSSSTVLCSFCALDCYADLLSFVMGILTILWSYFLMYVPYHLIYKVLVVCIFPRQLPLKFLNMECFADQFAWCETSLVMCLLKSSWYVELCSQLIIMGILIWNVLLINLFEVTLVLLCAFWSLHGTWSYVANTTETWYLLLGELVTRTSKDISIRAPRSIV